MTWLAPYVLIPTEDVPLVPPDSVIEVIQSDNKHASSMVVAGDRESMTSITSKVGMDLER